MIPIEELRELASKYKLSHIILFTHQPNEDRDHIVTYGETLEACSQAADFGNTLKTYLDWPHCLHAQPPRVKQLLKRIGELEDELKKTRAKT